MKRESEKLTTVTTFRINNEIKKRLDKIETVSRMKIPLGVILRDGLVEKIEEYEKMFDIEN